MMSGAWPPPAPSVWKAWMVRPLNAAMVSSTKPLSFSVSVWIITCTSNRSATERQQSIAAGVVPQSSCSFSDDAPARIISSSAAGREALPLPENAMLTGSALCGLQHARDVPRAGRAGGRGRAGRRPGAAADQRGDARRERLIDLLRADEMDVAVDAAGGEDLAFARDDFGAGADDDVDVRLDVGIAGFADLRDAAVGNGDVGLHDPPMIEDQRVGDDGVDRAFGLRRLALAHAVADHLAAAELHFVAIDGEVALDLDPEFGVGEPHAVAGGRAEHVGVGTPRNAGHQSSAPMTSPRKP